MYGSLELYIWTQNNHVGDNDASKMFSISLHNCSYCLIHLIPIDMKVPLESKSQIFISFLLVVHAGRSEISSEIKFWIIAFIWAIIYSVYSIWARGPCPQGMRKEPDFFYHNSGMPNSMRPFPVHPLCFWWCIYSCYSPLSVKSLCILRSVSSGLKLLNTFAHCCENEISDLGISIP